LGYSTQSAELLLDQELLRYGSLILEPHSHQFSAHQGGKKEIIFPLRILKSVFREGDALRRAHTPEITKYALDCDLRIESCLPSIETSSFMFTSWTKDCVFKPVRIA